MPLQAVRGLDEVARGALVQLLMVVGFLGSSFLHALALGVVDRAAEARALAPRHRLGVEAVEAHREPRRPRPAEGEAESGTAPESPPRHGLAR